MSILPTQAQQKLSPYQTAALDRQYSQATSLIPGIAASSDSTGDSLFISLDAQVALQQFEQAKGSSVEDSSQAPQAALVQSLTSQNAGQAPSFTSMSTQVALVQYQYNAQKQAAAET